MQLKELLNDDDAVSPVIGVILMVAITVILAAVIGTFVLGLGENVQDTNPQVSFSFNYDSAGTDSDCGTAPSGSGQGTLTITHDGGDKVEASQLTLVGSDVEGDQDLTSCGYGSGSSLTAGSNVDYGVESDDAVRVAWESTSGDSSATLGRWSGPDA